MATVSSLSLRGSSRLAPASFHSDWIASRTGSPERTVASTNAVEVVAREARARPRPGRAAGRRRRPARRSGRGPARGARPGCGAGARVIRDQVGERAQRNRRRAAGRLHPDRGQTLGHGGGAGLAGKPRFSQAGGCAHDDARAAVLPARAGDPFQLHLAIDQQPGGRCGCSALWHVPTVTDRDGHRWARVRTRRGARPREAAGRRASAAVTWSLLAGQRGVEQLLDLRELVAVRGDPAPAVELLGVEPDPDVPVAVLCPERP